MVRCPRNVTTCFVTAGGSLGAWIYPEYRSRLKHAIFVHAPTIGWLFERNEHLAVGAIGFAWIGCIAHLAARSFHNETSARRVAAMAHRA